MSKELKEYFNRVASPPAGWQENRFTNSENQKLRYGHAPATTPKTKGTVLLTHGYGECLEIYFETIKNYQEKGYDVWAMEWAGMGKSDPDQNNSPFSLIENNQKRPQARDMTRHVRDLEYFIDNVVPYDHETPFYMNTHSFGGHIGLLYLEKHKNTFDGAIMSAPMFDIGRYGLPEIFRKPVKFMFNAASKIGLKNIALPKLDSLSSNVADSDLKDFKKTLGLPGALREKWRGLAHKINPETNMTYPTFGWVAKAFESIEQSLNINALRSIQTPILIGSADQESLVDNKAHEKIAGILGEKARLIKIEQAGHNLFHSTNNVHKKWWDHISGFMIDVEEKKKVIQPENTGNTSAVYAT